ncbi:MAG TPA: hypothetical protein VHK70_07200 [Burkholderiaceae bacterium]|jgi:hypothetical protein|nr:hypothetical protein [Burkholderiaceae bacterium]
MLILQINLFVGCRQPVFANPLHFTIPMIDNRPWAPALQPEGRAQQGLGVFSRKLPDWNTFSVLRAVVFDWRGKIQPTSAGLIRYAKEWLYFSWRLRPPENSLPVRRANFPVSDINQLDIHDSVSFESVLSVLGSPCDTVRGRFLFGDASPPLLRESPSYDTSTVM